MNTTYIISKDTITTMLKGALGAMTFGMYHQFTTNKMMELNNEKQNLQHQYLMDKYQVEINETKEQINILNEQINILNNKKWWWR